MELNDDDEWTSSYQKKRKTERACDYCRRRKIKCIEASPPNETCTNCIAHNRQCTYETEPKKRGRPVGYVNVLEKRIKILEDVIRKLCPDQSVLHSLISPIDPEYASFLTNAPIAETNLNHSDKFMHTLAPEHQPEKKPSASSVADVIHKVASLSLSPAQDVLVHDQLEQKEVEANLEAVNSLKSSFFRIQRETGIAVKEPTIINVAAFKQQVLQNRTSLDRSLPWIKESVRHTVEYIFPSLDLLGKLTDAYFEHVNIFFPLLHRPTFERAVTNNLHLCNNGFGGVLLLVCALGSQYIEPVDERTFPDGVDSPHSTGWKWYSQVQVIKQSHLLEPPSLYDLQLYCLAIQYLSGCCKEHTVWVLVGFGMRLAQDIGFHHHKVSLDKLTVEEELWKRAFWVLIAQDRIISIGIGRPCSVFDEELDIEMPIECNDQYWEHEDPSQRFKQPEGVPCTVSAFNQHLRLTKIMAFAMNTVVRSFYSSLKKKFWEYILHEWEGQFLAELDSALNSWISSLPEYLRWDVNRTDERFYKLSAFLITTYYQVQIIVHRSHIRLARQPSAMHYPSLVICASAARSCSYVMEHHSKRFPTVYPHIRYATVASVIALFLNVVTSKRVGTSTELITLRAQNDFLLKRVGTSTELITLRQFKMCLSILKKAEERWFSARGLVDMFADIVNSEEEETSAPSRKRPNTDVSTESNDCGPDIGVKPSHVPYADQSFSNDVPGHLEHSQESFKTLESTEAHFEHTLAGEYNINFLPLSYDEGSVYVDPQLDFERRIMNSITQEHVSDTSLGPVPSIFTQDLPQDQAVEYFVSALNTVDHVMQESIWSADPTGIIEEWNAFFANSTGTAGDNWEKQSDENHRPLPM